MATPATRQRPNVLLTGTQGVGKSTLANKVAENLGFTYIDAAHEIKANKLYSEYDEERKCHVLNDDAFLDHLQDRFDSNEEIPMTGLPMPDCTPDHCTGGIWIGLSAEVGQPYKWVDGTALTWQHWGPTQSQGWNQRTFVSFYPDNFSSPNYDAVWDNYVGPLSADQHSGILCAWRHMQEVTFTFIRIDEAGYFPESSYCA
ncbi:Protein E02H1.6 [Aphelenchoides avenae]|nr:Protein E02H1.6 [Aphelenchus avenae]